MPRRRRWGFTLIELLVVVAIIALLAGLLFPVFVRAREAARTATCQSNLHQIGHAIYLYAEAWDEWLTPSLAPGHYVESRSQLTPYLGPGDLGIWFCPSDPLLEFRPDVSGTISQLYKSPRPFAYTQYGTSYVLALTYQTTPDGIPLRSFATVKHPATTIMATESGAGSYHPGNNYPQWMAAVEQFHWPRGLVPGIAHRGRANYLFADGHVKMLSLRQTLVPQVLWDRFWDWCPDCFQSSWPKWTQEDIQRDLAAMDQYHQP